MPSSDFTTTRTVFNSVADTYCEARPGYPAALIDDIFTYAGLDHSAKALEIGCGPGNATLLVAPRCRSLTCVELGKDLAEEARRNCAAFPHVNVITSAFEDWEPGRGVFDLVYAAQSFHWVDPNVGYAKCHALLRPGGVIALFWNQYPDSTEGAWPEIREIYNRYRCAWPGHRDKLTSEELTRVRRRKLEECRYFTGVEVRQHPWSQTYSTGEFVRLLSTYSDHAELPEATRNALLSEIAASVDKHGGRIERPYVAALYLGRARRL